MPQVRGDEISQQMEQLGKVVNQVTKFVQERVPFPLGEQIHEFVTRDQVWSRTGNTTPWPHIGRVHTLALSSPTAVKVADVTPWIHHMRVKRACHADPEDTERTTQQDPTDPCETKVILKKKKR